MSVNVEKLAEAVYKLMLEEARRERARGQSAKSKKRSQSPRAGGGV